jgi:hypothetical protein
LTGAWNAAGVAVPDASAGAAVVGAATSTEGRTELVTGLEGLDGGGDETTRSLEMTGLEEMNRSLVITGLDEMTGLEEMTR